MKFINKIFAISSLSLAFGFASCSQDNPIDKNNSVVKDEFATETGLDKWLKKNYLEPYNIEVVYKYDDKLTDFYYHVSPPIYQKSVQLSHLIKYMCIEPYDKVTGSTEFIKNTFPKQMVYIGTAGVKDNGTEILGVAEGGMKIDMYKVNILDRNNLAQMNFYFFHTIHHEFTHIQNQRKDYPTEFKAVNTDYVADTWSKQDTYAEPKDIKAIIEKENTTEAVTNYNNLYKELTPIANKEKNGQALTPEETQKKMELEMNIAIIKNDPVKKAEIDRYNAVKDFLKTQRVAELNARRKGFISPYASSNHGEDIAELQAFFITDTVEEWNLKVLCAGEEGARKINEKMNIVKSYLKNSWNLDIEKLRDEVQARVTQLSNIDIDSTDVTN